MNVTELSRAQLIELKENMLSTRAERNGDYPAWGDLAEADSLISDKEVFKEYANVNFTVGDFISIPKGW